MNSTPPLALVLWLITCWAIFCRTENFQN